MTSTIDRLRAEAYQLALRGMFKLSPERIHEIINTALSGLQAAGPVNRALAKILPVNDPVLRQEVFGVEFPRPLGLAAGFDKNAAAADTWTPIGFGYAELGTVTAQAQPGNPAPRLFRLKADKAILNRMGFNNEGAAAAAENLRKRRYSDVIGINIGKTKVTPAEHAVEDYRRSASVLGDLADFLVVNVSSPNTPGLRSLQFGDSLKQLLDALAVRREQLATEYAKRVPLAIKIAPDMTDEETALVAAALLESGMDAVIATNTTLSREGVESLPYGAEAGCLSGAPVLAKSTHTVKVLAGELAGRMPIIAAGGITEGRHAAEKIAAGASLVQIYSGFIYKGPALIREAVDAIAALR